MLALGLLQKLSFYDFFSFLAENVLKWVPKSEGGKVPKMVFLLRFYSLVPLWVPLASFSLNFGLPGHHFGTFLGEIQHHQGTQNSMKINPQSNWAGFIDESSNRPDCSAVAGLAFRQLDILPKGVKMVLAECQCCLWVIALQDRDQVFVKAARACG